MQTTEKKFRMEFRSIPTRAPEDSWVVRLHFPPNIGSQGDLPLEAIDGHEKPIEKGTFEFMGKKCPISTGSGAIRYADFIAGIHEKAVWFYRPGRQPIPGGLTFA